MAKSLAAAGALFLEIWRVLRVVAVFLVAQAPLVIHLSAAAFHFLLLHYYAIAGAEARFSRLSAELSGCQAKLLGAL